MYYKVAPPSERKRLNFSLLSSAPESEIGTNAPMDLGRSFARFSAVGRENIQPKSDNFLFSISKSVLPPCCSFEAGSEAKVTFLNLPPTPKEFRNQMLNFSIAAHLSSSWKIWRRLAQQSWIYRDLKNKTNNKDLHNTNRALLAALECARLINLDETIFI